jgi:hypothetical protein
VKNRLGDLLAYTSGYELLVVCDQRRCCFKVDLGRGEVHSFAQAGEDDGIGIVSFLSESTGDSLPTPAAEPHHHRPTRKRPSEGPPLSLCRDGSGALVYYAVGKTCAPTRRPPPRRSRADDRDVHESRFTLPRFIRAYDGFRHQLASSPHFGPLFRQPIRQDTCSRFAALISECPYKKVEQFRVSTCGTASGDVPVWTDDHRPIYAGS